MKLIDGITGSGKSSKIKQHIAKTHKEQKYLVSVPTLQMVKQTERDLKKLGTSYVITLDSTRQEDIQGQINKNTHKGSSTRVVIITHTSLANLGKRILFDTALQKHLSSFELIIDEVPAAFWYSNVNMQKERNFKWWEYTDRDKGKIILQEDCMALARSSWSDKDGHSDNSRDFLWCMLAGYTGRYKSTDGSTSLSIMSHSPSIEVLRYCKESYLISANVENSPFVFVLNNWLGIATERCYELEPDKNRQSHLNTNRITCYSYFRGTASLTKMAREGVFEDMCSYASSILNEDFIYVSNADKRGKINYPFKEVSDSILKGVRVKYYSHGINLFGGSGVHGLSEEELEDQLEQTDNIDLYNKGFAKAAWLATSRLNPSLKIYINHTCTDRGCDGEELIRKVEAYNSFEASYQMVTRTLIRNQEDNTPITLFFLDEATMNYVCDHYLLDAKRFKYDVSIGKRISNVKQKNLDFTLIKRKEGWTQKQISIELGTTVQSVKNYCRELKKKKLL